MECYVVILTRIRIAKPPASDAGEDLEEYDVAFGDFPDVVSAWDWFGTTTYQRGKDFLGVDVIRKIPVIDVAEMLGFNS